MPARYSVYHAGGVPAYQVGFAIPEHALRGTLVDLQKALDDVIRCGARWLRTDAYWNVVEETQGTYTWTGLDRISSECAARSIRLVFVAHTMPPWARPSLSDPDVTGPTTSAQRDGYCRFVAALAKRYPSAAVEIWNEPNLDQFWHPTPSATDYRTLLAQAYGAIKASNPSTFVLGICTGGASGAPDIGAVDFASAVFASGGVHYMDGASHHPYALQGGVSGSLLETPLIQAAAKSAGRPVLPVWGTETGCSTGGTDTPVVSEEVHARSAVDVWRYWDSIHARGPLFWYTMYDPPAADLATSRYAPIRSDGSDKPIVSAMRALSAATTRPGFIQAEWGVCR